MRFAVIAIAIGVLSSNAAFADSDGSYCAARGYLAFETRLATAKHELHIVRFGAAGIAAAAPIALDDFQVHGMTCRANQIDVHGWDRIYTVDIGAGKPAVRSRAAAFEAGTARPAENLGHLATPQVIDLDAEGANRFQIVIARVSWALPTGGIEHHTVTRLVQRQSARPGSGIVASRQLLESVFLETID